MAKKTGVNLQNVCVCLLVLLLFIVLLNVVTIGGIKNLLAGGKQTSMEKAGAAKVEVTLLTAPECSQCADLSGIITALAQVPDITFETADHVSIYSFKGKKLAEKYKIIRAPAVVIIGKTEKLEIPGFEKINDALVFSKGVPYWDVTASINPKGIVAVTHLKDSSCGKCQDLNRVIVQLKQAGVAFSSEKTVEASSSEGKELIEKYGVTRLPTLLFSNDLMEYDFAKQVWNDVGTTAEDGTLVMRQIPPPYYNSSEGRVRGLVEAKMLVDKSCNECYNPEMHLRIIQQNLNIYIEKNETVDVNSKQGKELLKKYNIELVPMVMLSPEANVYSGMQGIWKQVGSIENDGWFLFRSVHLLSGVTYKNLTSGIVVNSTV